MSHGTLSVGTVQFCVMGRVTGIVYVFSPLWKWSRLGMVEIKFLANAFL